ncbi:histidine phosphatase family protein [Candidatus Uhrbacteria bacterium]|nr:histidine phosphatase family protein [Candidatus Uhrbacteria bacterium]
MKIFLIRHGETTGDIEDRYGGSYDDHLTETGEKQMGATASKLVGSGIEAIFTSPLIRALEAAQIIKSATAAPIEIISDLAERHYGILTGLTKEEAKQKYPEAVHQHEDYLNTDPEGEGYDHFCDRVTKAFRSIRAKDHKTVAIVTHGGPIKCILRSLEMSVPDRLDDGAIVEVEV